MVPFWFENFFDETVIIINSIKSQPLGTGILKQTDKIRILHAAIKWLPWGKTLCDWVMQKPLFFLVHHLLLEGITNRQTMVIQIWVSGRHYIENRWSKSITSSNTAVGICCQ